MSVEHHILQMINHKDAVIAKQQAEIAEMRGRLTSCMGRNAGKQAEIDDYKAFLVLCTWDAPEPFNKLAQVALNKHKGE